MITSLLLDLEPICGECLVAFWQNNLACPEDGPWRVGNCGVTLDC